MNPQFWWYVARASGMVAAVLLAATVVWGLLASTRLLRRPGLPAWLLDLHRGLGGLTVVFVAVHLAALVADSTVHFAWAELFLPFASAWRRGPVAWGVAAFWGLVVVEGTSLLQRRMSRRTWRRIHYASYPVALLTAVHAATAGTDASSPVFTWTAIGAIATITILVLVRIIRSMVLPARPAGRTARPRPAGGPGVADAPARIVSSGRDGRDEHQVRPVVRARQLRSGPGGERLAQRQHEREIADDRRGDPHRVASDRSSSSPR